MNILLRSLLLALLLPLCAFSQNMPPVISNLTVNHSTATQSIAFSFDLSDVESDPSELQLHISADSGRTWLVQLDSIVGDTGFPIAPGVGKSITWTYNLAALSNSFPLGARDFSARIVADDRMPINIQDIVDQVDSARLVQTLGFVEGIRHRVANPAHLNAVRDSIRSLMVTEGLQDWHHTWNYSGSIGQNFSGRLSGTAQEDSTWLISGHYDSVNNSPGADDNGTATAAVMEAVRVLSSYHFRNSIRFMAFDLEEAGLRGSKEYVNNHIEDWEQIGGLLNMEMIGYKDEAVNSQSFPAGFNLLFPMAYQQSEADSFRGNFLTNVANVASNPLKTVFDNCAAQFVPDLKVISLAAPGTGTLTPDLRRSDHAPFWDAGYQALMLTDAADLRNPNYHSAADTIGTLDLQFYVQSTKAVIATLVKLAQPQHAGTALSTSVTLQVPVGLTTSQKETVFMVYPNPTSGSLRMNFAVETPEAVRFFILDNQGRQVAALPEKVWPVGQHTTSWDGNGLKNSKLPAGNYWIVFQQGEQRVTRSLRLVR